MKYRRKKQLTIILILVAVISSISIGFAAFSATLNISSSATVTPNSDNFSIVFSSSSYAITTRDDSGTLVSGVGTNGAQGGITNLYRKSATGLTAQFTEPGQALSTTFYIHNTGEYDAYLRGVNISSINGNSYKKCIAASGTTDSLVQSACEGINIVTTINGQNYSFGESISGHKIEKGTSQPIVVVVAYAPDAARADGNFDIEFGDISLEYSTVDSNTKLITFKVFNETFTAESGMTWDDFINSSYNIGNRFTADPWVGLDDNRFYLDAGHEGFQRQSGTDLIIENGVYV
jgi:hypothetical protein